MANKQVYTIDINTSGLISGYKSAIKQMEQAGVSSDVTKGLTSSLKKLEKSFETLSNEGKAGFTNSKEIENYQKRVERLFASFRGFETQLEGVGGKIEKVSSKLREVKKNLESAFVKLNFKNVTDAMKDITSATDKEAKLTEIVKKELQERAKAVDDLRQKYEQAAQAATIANANIANNQLSSKEKKKIDGKAIWTSGKNKPDELTRKAIASQADAIAKAATDGTEAWRQFQDYLKNNGLDKVFSVKSIDLVRQRIIDLQAAYASGASEIERERIAQEALNRAQDAFNQIGKVTKDGTLVPLRNVMTELRNGAQNLSRAQQNVGNIMEDSTADMLKLDAAQRAVSDSAQSVAGSANKASVALDADISSVKQVAQASEKTASAFEEMRQKLLMFFSATSLFNGLRNQIKQTFNDVKTLDKAFGSIAMVTNETLKSMWGNYNQYNQMAKSLGQSTEGVIKASALFRQQGLDTADALSLTEDTMKLATLAGADFATATEEMTSAIRGFKMEMSEGAHVTDVYSELAAHAAASVDDIAQAMARTASIANSAGMSFENTSAFLTQMIETTQESAENIGTSMKTIIARFTELKTNIAGTSESEFTDLDFNKVDTALKSVGVALKDTQGQFRDLDQVFLELSSKWDTLDRNTQRYVATIAAGSRQQSRFIAMMDNYERTAELMELAADAEGKADEQFAKYADTMEYKINQLKNTWESFRVSLMNADLFKGFIDGLTEVLEKVKNLDAKKVFVLAPFAISAAKNFVLTFISQIKTMASSFSQVGQIIASGINKTLKKIPVLKLFYKFEQDAAAEQQNLKRIKLDLAALQQAADDRGLNLTLQLNEKSIIQAQTDIAQVFDAVENKGMSTSAAIVELTQRFANLGINAETTKAILTELGLTEDTLSKETAEAAIDSLTLADAIHSQGQAAKASEAKLKRFETIQKSMSTSVSQLTSGLTLMFSAMIAGTSAIDSGRMAVSMFSTQLISMVTTAIPQLIIAWRAEAVAATTASAETIAAAEAAKTALISTGVGAAIAVIGLAIAELISLMGKLSESKDAAKVASSTIGQLEEQNNRLAESMKKLAEKTNSAKEELSDTEEKLKKLEDAYKSYINKTFLTTEETEEFRQVSEDLANIMPEIVSYYDQEGNAVLKDKTAIEQLIEAKKKLRAEQEQNVAALSLETSLDAFTMANNNVTNYQKELKDQTNSMYLETLKWVKDANLVGRDYVVDELTTDANKGNQYKAAGSAWQDNEEIYIEAPDGTKYYSTDDWAGMSGVGLLKGIRDSSDANDIGTYLRDALVSAGVNGAFNVNEKDTGIEVIDSIMDELADGKRSDEQAALEKLQDALRNYPEELDKLFGDAVRDAAEKKAALDDAIKTTIKAGAGSNEAYGTASKNVQMIVDNYISQQHGLSVSEIEEDFKKTDEGKAFLDNQGNIIEGQTAAYNDAFNKFLTEKVQTIIDPTKLDKELSSVINKYGKYIDNFYEEVLINGTSPLDQLKKLKEDNKNGLVDDSVVDAMLTQYQQEIEKQIAGNDQLASAIGGKATSDKFGFLTGLGEGNNDILNFYNSLGFEAREAFAEGIGDYSNKHGDANAFAKQWAEAFKDVPAEVADYLNKIDKKDWSSFSGLNEGTFKDKIVKGLVDEYDIAEDKAEEYFNLVKNLAVKTGQINLEYVNTAQLEAWNESVEKITEAIQKNDDIIKKYASDNRESIRVTAEDYEKLSKAKEALMAAGIPKEQLDNVLKIDEATKSWVLNGKQWNEAIKTSSVYTAQMAEKQLEINKKKLEDRNLTQQERTEIEVANTRLEQMIESQKTLNQYTAAMVGYWESIADKVDKFANLSSTFGSAGKKQKDDGYLGVKEISSLNEAFRAIGDEEFDVTRFVNNQMQLNIDTLYEYINAKITEIEVSGQLTEASKEELLMWKAMKKELIATRNEVNAASDALQDKATKAMEDYEAQQETVIEKQKSLNDKLKEYNDLLYGSDNRKTGLDLLYNYEQAISNLNDEMERSKELLEDSKTREEAYQSLTRYTQATHAYIAEEKARQKVIEQGLANYAEMIESGSALYTNAETGEQINVNFGDYARKDSRTGKYIIDQRLLEESKFTDKYKELIEEQISTYNDYVDKYKQSEDTIRKIEKEIQEQRETAVKNYAAMEKTIADMLKEQYEKEVDALKEKYDAMKNADDDYLDALQDAIDKQRQLRDQENAWEDLAQKEKKLSLMQRDTSGTNELETRKLEDEIEDDRQNLLDQAVDNIIDGLSKLYESQQELRDSELELKDALLDNTLYWNSQAESLAASFTSAEEYAEFLSSLSTEYASMTLTMQQEKLNEYGDEFSQASMYLAMTAMDEASETGDFIVETVAVSGDEISTIVAETSETFTTEVIRAYDETTEAFNKDLEKAQEEIAKARAELEQAIAKLNELATKANEAAAAVANAEQTIEIASNSESPDSEESNGIASPSLYNVLTKIGIANEALDDISHKYSGEEQIDAMLTTLGQDRHREWIGKLSDEEIQTLKDYGFSVGSLGQTGKPNKYIIDKNHSVVEDYIKKNAASWYGGHIYATGGMVDYTGPAWVDGTPERPEAFLSAEDTERIGEAAKILSDIPWLDRDTDNTSVVTNNGGDVSVEINLNIDHISSDTDIDEMIQRVKDEIVDVARPEGANVILQQQLN